MSDKKVKLNTAGSLKAFLSHVMDEGVKSALAQRALTEKEKQGAFSSNGSEDEESSGGGSSDLFGGDDDASGGGEEEQGSSSKTMDDETEKLKGGDIKPKDIVDKLNSIRSGKSFKDSAVSSSMEEYIGSLSKPEKVALLAFLKGIAQIVTGEVPAQNASDPGDSPSDVKMDKGNTPKVVHKKPNVIKGGSQQPSSGGNNGQTPVSAEDTSAPAPITPRKR